MTPASPTATPTPVVHPRRLPPRHPLPRRLLLRRLGSLIALVAVAFLAAACSGGPSVDEVTVRAGSASVVLPQALSCATVPGATEMLCSGGETDDDAPHATLGPGVPVEIEVPQEVGDTPWVIVFSYVDPRGEIQGDRTAVFSAEERYSYQLTPPEGAQLTRLEVQSLSAAPGADGGIEFPAIGTWVLVVDPASGQS